MVLHLQQRVRIFDEKNGMLVKELWSNADGTWDAVYLNRNTTYLVVCYDGVYVAQCYDHVVPEVMS